jgi:hypothetical protein
MAVRKGGKHAYSGNEVANLSIGQNGFDIWYNGSTPSNDEGYWIALKCVGSTDIEVHAESVIGDDLDRGSTNKVTIGAGDIVYGCFNKIVSATIGATTECLIAYRG